ncbi:Ras-related protein RABA1c [Camellia lanceoleosa]|uniref:Ras-related protein RABA1c n=1 Tax=Camellia lanceoleosa TaxID=1840588 RepID=A0ACC0HWT4_9ERIC|nr:Ras-related protein RABA1c [Camellia lanceoleosa]
MVVPHILMLSTWWIIIQISIYGKMILLLRAESTKDRTLRQLRNQRGHTLQCSHYVGSPFPEDTPLPCVVYCHGNSLKSKSTIDVEFASRRLNVDGKVIKARISNTAAGQGRSHFFTTVFWSWTYWVNGIPARKFDSGNQLIGLHATKPCWKWLHWWHPLFNIVDDFPKIPKCWSQSTSGPSE